MPLVEASVDVVKNVKPFILGFGSLTLGNPYNIEFLNYFCSLWKPLTHKYRVYWDLQNIHVVLEYKNKGLLIS